MSSENPTGFDFEALADTLTQFLSEHTHNAQIRELAIGNASVLGRRVTENDKLRYLGDWVIEGAPSRLTATYSKMLAPDEVLRLTVHIDAGNGVFQVTDWFVEQSF